MGKDSVQKPDQGRGRDVGGLLAAGLVGAIGLFFTLGALNYDLGTARRMGPGYYPLLMGAACLVVSLLILLPALRRPATRVIFEAKPALMVAAGIAAFAVAIPRFGLVPAVFLAAAISALGHEKTGLLDTILLAAFLSAGAWLIFIVGLGLPLPVVKGLW